MAGKTLTAEPSFEGKHILLTGASGYIAHTLIEALKNFACTIVRLDRKPPLERVEGIANIVDIAGDVRDKSIFGRVLEDVDIVFHLAGQTSLYWAEENPLEDYGINVVPMLDLLETCRRRGRKPTIIFSGTATEAGVPRRVPVNEAFRDRPASIYDFHKLMALKNEVKITKEVQLSRAKEIGERMLNTYRNLLSLSFNMDVTN